MVSQGVDSSYCVRINVSVERGIIWSTSVHDIHKGDVSFSLVYTFKVCIRENFGVSVVVQKKALRFRDQYDNICVGFFQTVFPFIDFIWYSPLTFDYPCSLMLGFAFRFYIFPNRIKVDIWLNRPYDGEFRCHYFLSFNDMCFRVNISYGWKVLNNFLIGNWMKIVCVIKAYFYQELYFVYVIGTFIALKLKTLVQIHGFILNLH